MRFFRTRTGMLLVGGFIAAVLIFGAAFSLIRASGGHDTVIVAGATQTPSIRVLCTFPAGLPTLAPSWDGRTATAEAALDHLIDAALGTVISERC